ncbi:hypothetical protein PROPEN_03526 [Proteus penneri ATCC 35198]|nr:hypothetical protein PROPEN_03526 [Proteus penneri ATCC 35198]
MVHVFFSETKLQRGYTCHNPHVLLRHNSKSLKKQAKEIKKEKKYIPC